MPLHIKHQDITTLHVDAIVNAANTRLRRAAGYAARSSARPTPSGCRKPATPSLRSAPETRWRRLDSICPHGM